MYLKIRTSVSLLTDGWREGEWRDKDGSRTRQIPGADISANEKMNDKESDRRAKKEADERLGVFVS